MNLSPKERLKQQKKYSEKLHNGEDYLVVRWKQNVSFMGVRNK